VAGAGEAALVARLLGEFRDFLNREEPGDASLLESVERLMDDDHCEFLLGSPTPEGEASAVCQLRYRYGVWYATDDCWLEDLYVAEGTRRSGLGAAMLGAAIARARVRGCARVELDTDDGNEAALALYRRFGFSAEDAGGELKVFMRLRL
jgi:ribosomal protein S18 acetylase RimI-like enzyme